ncbi:CocE/NonD family hydrolase [Nocardia huaxiensis]|uniref:CocE/NonD family hydrolase n=1 Tax=Nocardia huaxiensis TaxID=2755382 RepID=A0A7D6ZHE9_9NOCA|nr:CocE/NonD family hydrolase [Nocardia huaxiensis]QLY28043.1 CocE/NonD family hydrolase [Nocardia huaxiensis]
MTHPDAVPRLRPGTSPTGSRPHDARFDIGPKRFRRVWVERGVPIRLADGTVLSADITRPAHRVGVPVTDLLPAIVTFTPYNKTLLTRVAPLLGLAQAAGPLLTRVVPPSPGGRATRRELLRTLGGGAIDLLRANRVLVSRGYVHVHIDVRGTGSSTGVLQIQSEREQLDSVEALRWVREQPWCDGDIGLYGISYSAISALHAAARRPEGVKAVFAMVGSTDPGNDLLMTGGAHTGFMIAWLAVVNAAKWVPTVPGLVASGAAGSYLRDRLASPLTRFADVVGLATRDEHPMNFADTDVTEAVVAVDRITAPTWIHSGWHDIFDRGNTRAFEQLRLSGGAKQLVMDDTFHITSGSGFGAPGNPQRLNELHCAFFDRWIKGIDNGIDEYGPVTVRQLGSGDWVRRDRFPHPEVSVQKWYLCAVPSGVAEHVAIDGSLVDIPARKRAHLDLPDRRPGFASQTTTSTLMGVPALLGRSWIVDDRSAERAAVVFTGAPLPADLLLSGTMNLHLRVLATGTEAFWVVTVCDVAPDGSSAVISRGALRSSRRALDPVASTWLDGELVGAEHPRTRESILPVLPDEPHELDIHLNATEAVLRAGHRLRVAVARRSWPRYQITPAMSRNIKGQAIILDPKQPSWLACQAVYPE